MLLSFESLPEPLHHFEKIFSASTELSSVALGGRVVAVSDEFFAEAHHLLLVEPAPSMKGQFGPNGALYSGWETRRHNPTNDWCIIQLGTSGNIVGFDIDTSHFNGNEAPEASVEIMHGAPSEVPKEDDLRWTEIIPKTRLGPNSRHLLQSPPTKVANFVKLKIFPDGGVARFRVYGEVSPVHPEGTSSFDLAHVFAGGRVVYTSDQHFGIGSNLILPGRGKDMGDGWETKRSRVKGHKDWVIIKLGTPGYLDQVEIDTAHFKGNFPESCEMHGLFTENDLDVHTQGDEDMSWTLILPRTKLGPHRQHYFQLENVEGKFYTHVRLTIYPDGGLKRVRILGRKAGLVASSTLPNGTVNQVAVLPEIPSTSSDAKMTTIPVVPLTPEAFAPFGQVIQGYKELASVPKGQKVTKANGGTADKFHKQTLLESSYPSGSNATAGVSVYRCKPLADISEDGTIPLTVLERHPFTNQAFIAMGRGEGEGLSDPGNRYLVVVAKNGAEDRPDMGTLRAFWASSAQGVVYSTAIWHQPLTVLEKPLDLACIETQIGDGSQMDCEILDLDVTEHLYRLRL